MITKEQLENRITKLYRGMNQLEQNAAQIQTAMAAQRGAISEVEALLKLWDEIEMTPEPAKEEGPQSTE